MERSKAEAPGTSRAEALETSRSEVRAMRIPSSVVSHGVGLILLAVTVLVPRPLAAHEGHGLSASVDGVVHWLSSATHVGSVVVAAGVGVVIAATLGLRRRGRRRAIR